MNIVFITTQLPYPANSGGVIKTNKLLIFLSKYYKIDLFYLIKGDDVYYQKEFLKKIQLNSSLGFKCHDKRNFENLIKSYWKGIPLNFVRNYSKELEVELEKKLDSVQAIWFDHYEVTQYIPKSFKGKIIFHTHNAEFLLWRRFAENETNFFKKLAVKIESERIKKVEKIAIKQSNLIFASPNDIEAFKSELNPSANYAETFHLGEEEFLEFPELKFSSTENRLIFLGTLTWEPNINGIIWFINEVWPIVKKVKPETKLTIIGRNPSQRIIKASKIDFNIEITGFVENLENYYRISRVHIVPLKFGSGIKVKFLNALYRGLPTVTTSIGAEGLSLSNGKNCFIEDNPQNFAQKIVTLLENENIWNQMKIHSRETGKKYTWDKLLNAMKNSFESII